MSIDNWTLLIPWLTEQCACFTILFSVVLEILEDVFVTVLVCSL